MGYSGSFAASPTASQNSTYPFEFDVKEQNTTFSRIFGSPSTLPYLADANRTVNVTQLSETPELIRLAAYFVPIFFGLIICVGLTGNCLVITVMTKISNQHGQRLNSTNRFILNLAISDLLFLIFCVPFHATVYTFDGWLFGEFLCVFSKFCEEMTKITSVYSLVALSFDRFLAVAYATSARQIRTRANAIKGLIFIWIAGAGMATPVIVTRTHTTYLGTTLCIPSKSWNKWYELCITLFGYVLPLFVIICCYVGLLCTICKTARNSSVTVSNSSNDSRKKVTRIVVVVVIVFAICWMPHHIVSLWISFDPNFNFTSLSTFAFRLLAHCMAYANSCINPLIYAFVSKKFRQDFKKACTCQYLSEAVGSMKKFSQRVIGTVRYSRNNGSSSLAGDDAPGRKGTRGQSGAPGATGIVRGFSPRSPLGGVQRILEEDTTMLSLDDLNNSQVTKYTGMNSPVTTTHNFRQDVLIVDNENDFDNDARQDTAFF